MTITGRRAATTHTVHHGRRVVQLAALEREVGLPLTERRGRRVALTPAGQLLARQGRDIVNQVGVAAMEVAALREGIAGTYRVAAFPTAARSFVAQAWRQLVEEPASGPALRLVELEPVDSVPALVAGDVDLAVTRSYSDMAPMAHPESRAPISPGRRSFWRCPAPTRPRLHQFDTRIQTRRGSGSPSRLRTRGLDRPPPPMVLLRNDRTGLRTGRVRPPRGRRSHRLLHPTRPRRSRRRSRTHPHASPHPSTSCCADSPSPCTDICISRCAVLRGTIPVSPGWPTCSRTPRGLP